MTKKILPWSESSTRKLIVASFYNFICQVVVVELKQRRTLNSTGYTIICLIDVFWKIRNKSMKERLILHHDYTSTRTSAQTKEFLIGQIVELMSHPPLSPDLKLNALSMLPHKKILFSTPEEMHDAFDMYIFKLSSVNNSIGQLISKLAQCTIYYILNHEFYWKYCFQNLLWESCQVFSSFEDMLYVLSMLLLSLSRSTIRGTKWSKNVANLQY